LVVLRSFQQVAVLKLSIFAVLALIHPLSAGPFQAQQPSMPTAPLEISGAERYDSPYSFSGAARGGMLSGYEQSNRPLGTSPTSCHS
jgi:hypothetical protein